MLFAQDAVRGCNSEAAMLSHAGMIHSCSFAPAVALGHGASAGLRFCLLAAELQRGRYHDERHLLLLLQRGCFAQVQAVCLPHRPTGRQIRR